MEIDTHMQMAECRAPMRAQATRSGEWTKIGVGFRVCFVVLLAGASAITLQVFGGHPMWPPPKHSAEYRQANQLFLRFQDALAGQQWEDALSLCSDRVRAKASEWPSPQAFFQETVPVDLLLAQDFGYWSLRADAASIGGTEKATFFGLLVPLTESNAQPF